MEKKTKLLKNTIKPFTVTFWAAVIVIITFFGSVAKNICYGYNKIKRKSKVVTCYLIPLNGSIMKEKLFY